MARKRKPISAPVLKALRSMARSKKGVTLGQLKKVYRRGQGAWLSGSRPKIGMTQWALARARSFTRGSRKHDLDLRRKKRKR